MVVNIKKRQHYLKIIRRFQEDIWGKLAVMNKPPSRILNLIYEASQTNLKYKDLTQKSSSVYFLSDINNAKFSYRAADEEKEFKRLKRTLHIKKYLSLLKLRRFYGNLKLKKFKKGFKKLALNPNFVNRIFPYYLESRLDVVLYRANFFKSIFAARQYINHKKVYVNGILVRQSSYRVRISDFVSVSDPDLIYNSLKSRLLSKNVLVNYPAYLCVNYKLGLIKFLRLPQINEVPFPFKMNLKVMAHNFTK